MNETFLQSIQNFENALTDMRGNAIFPNATWARSPEYYRERYVDCLKNLSEAWVDGPQKLRKLHALSSRCCGLYSQNEVDAATALATEINSLLYRKRIEILAI